LKQKTGSDDPISLPVQEKKPIVIGIGSDDSNIIVGWSYPMQVQAKSRQ
jgi:hypothetical protein